MGTIRVVWGSAAGPTEIAAYDAALAEANVHNYNLVGVSSVIPADASIEEIDTAPDLGPAGNRLTVVQAHHVTAGPGRVTAGLAWATTDDGPGIFYEASGTADEADIREELAQGLAAGQNLRDWEFTDKNDRIVSTDAESGTYTSAVVLAVYGESESIL